MDEMLQEFVNSRDVQVRVDREQGVIRGVKLLGLDSRNARRYLPAALAQAARLYEDAKVNVNHPKGHPLAARDYQDRIGSIRNVRVSESEGLFGDFHFNPKHALAEQLMWDATHAPENVGFSHNVEARTSRQGGQTVVEAILKVQSVDLVADPATTRGLFESALESTDAAEHNVIELLAEVTLEQLREARPDLVAGIEAPVASELARVQGELDRLAACEAVHERRELAIELLREYRLPEPVSTRDGARPLVSDLFWEALLAAPNERAMRVMVQERAELIAAARAWDPRRHGSGRPVSREQARTEAPSGVTDARSFARAIS